MVQAVSSKVMGSPASAEKSLSKRMETGRRLLMIIGFSGVLARSLCLNRNQRSVLVLFLSVSLLVSPVAKAEDINLIDVGDTYYINNLLSENDLVVVRRIDKSRGLVKVSYAKGGTEWVEPSKLLRRSQSRQADQKEAVAGMVAVGGVLWAILDPEGFNKAMKSSPKSGTSSTNQTASAPKQTSPAATQANVVQIEAVPFAPVVEGRWVSQSSIWINWARTSLEKHLGKELRIEAVKTKIIPFYSTPSREVYLVEAVEEGHLSAYYILAVSDSQMHQVLDGSGTSISKFNRALGFQVVSAKQAVEYVKFFSSAIAAESGIFLILEPNADFLPSNTRKSIGIPPMEVAKTVGEAWNIYADVIYGDNIYATVLQVDQKGGVKMLSDTFKKQISFRYHVAMKQGRRYYFAN
ncbi:hypothetical protein ACTL6U_15910 [Rhodovibrionaceae bacterium A322]